MKRLLERARLAIRHGTVIGDRNILRDLDAAIEADPLGRAVELLRKAIEPGSTEAHDRRREAYLLTEDIRAFLADIDKQTGPEAQGS